MSGGAFLLFALLMPALARAQTYAAFGNWIVGCDNVGMCSALGLSPANESNAYVRITSAGSAGGAATIVVALASDDQTRPRTIAVATLSASGQTTRLADVAATGDGEYVRASLTGVAARNLLAALRRARTLEIGSADPEKPMQPGTVLLDGAAAAFASLDAHRESRTPPAVVAQLMTVVSERPTAVPRGSHIPDSPNCRNVDDLWIRLSPRAEIRGICVDAGAYNTTYRFYFVGAGGIRPADFSLPWRKRDADSGTLVNPTISADGKAITAYTKGVGYGGCGESSDWVWTGATFALLRFSEMRSCRGVPSEDWPVLFQARRI